MPSEEKRSRRKTILCIAQNMFYKFRRVPFLRTYLMAQPNSLYDEMSKRKRNVSKSPSQQKIRDDYQWEIMLRAKTGLEQTKRELRN